MSSMSSDSIRIAPGQADLIILNNRRLNQKEESLGEALAALGWVPPSTAAGMRTKLHEQRTVLEDIRKLLK